VTTTKKHRTDVKSSTPTAENEQNWRFIILEPPSTQTKQQIDENNYYQNLALLI
jgi:hypothetical protein